MVFADRSVHKISTEEIRQLVASKESEKQDLEFKATVDLEADRTAVCAEILEDIVAMANGGGGYIVVGINEERGSNRASGFFPLSKAQINKIHQAISDWSVQHISERISGLELDARAISADGWVLLIHVPTGGKPHMVTFNHETKFVIRHGDRKREMTIGEIRQAFNNDYFGARMTRLEHGLRKVDERVASRIARSIDLSASVRQATNANEAFATRFAQIEKLSRKLFWIAAAPRDLSSDMLDLNAKSIVTLLKAPPGQRYGGWNIQVVSGSPKYNSKGDLILGDDQSGLHVYPNGFTEFLIDLDYFNHNQDEEKFATNPVLYPFAVVEFPVSFVRLYAEVCKLFSPQPESVQFTAALFNIKNARLFAGHPQSVAYSFAPYQQSPFPEDNLFIEPFLKASPNFDPNVIAYQLIREIYKRFGHPQDHIPFFDPEEKTFSFS